MSIYARVANLIGLAGNAVTVAGGMVGAYAYFNPHVVAEYTTEVRTLADRMDALHAEQKASREAAEETRENTGALRDSINYRLSNLGYWELLQTLTVDGQLTVSNVGQFDFENRAPYPVKIVQAKLIQGSREKLLDAPSIVGPGAGHAFIVFSHEDKWLWDSTDDLMLCLITEVGPSKQVVSEAFVYSSLQSGGNVVSMFEDDSADAKCW